MDDHTASFLPFHAISQFMRDDYLRTVVQSVLVRSGALPESRKSQLNRLIKTQVTIPGFRNPVLAPAMLKVGPVITAFQKRPEIAAAVLAGWMDLMPTLRDQVYELLKSRGWEILPVEADRTKLPGFLTIWPKGEDFDILNQAFKERYPESTETTDDVSLAAVWISGRLPYSNPEEE